jgi:hypothetical protein
MTEARDDEVVGPVGPSDKEVVALLQRLASARAQLLQAEHAAEEAKPDLHSVTARNDEIEEAHTELLWAQAQFITAAKEQRAQKGMEAAKLKEKQVLRRYGFTTFRDYLTARTSVPTTDIHLELARHEFEAAQHEWDEVSQQLAVAEDAAAPTVVLDLTGDNPRRIA